jgi:hypothetical protein
VLLKLLVTSVLPLAIEIRRRNGAAPSFAIHSNEGPHQSQCGCPALQLRKMSTTRLAPAPRSLPKNVNVDLADVDYIDLRFLDYR